MKAITANALSDGLVIYLDTDNQWTDRLENAQIFSDDEAALSALTTAKLRTTEITDAYLIDVTEDKSAGGREALRETIRNQGPTIRLDLGKQAS